MIISALKQTLVQTQTQVNPAYQRVKLKEAIQDYILNFVYNDSSNNL
jgi:hypothetical protein